MIQFIDALAIFFIIISSIIGFKRGIIEELGRFLGIIFSSIFALKLYIPVSIFFQSLIKIDPWALFVLCFFILFIFILFLIRVLTKLVHFLFLSKNTKWINRIMGTTFGALKGTLLVMIFFWMFEIFPSKKTTQTVIKESELAVRLIRIRKTVIKTFNWSDPVKQGEKMIQKYLNISKVNNE